MQLQEMSKKEGPNAKSYAAVVTAAPKSEKEFLEEWRQIGAALIKWKEHRQSEAKSVMLTVVSDPGLHPRLKQIIHKIYADEATLSPLLKSLDVRVALLNARGQAVEEFRLGA